MFLEEVLESHQNQALVSGFSSRTPFHDNYPGMHFCGSHHLVASRQHDQSYVPLGVISFDMVSPNTCLIVQVQGTANSTIVDRSLKQAHRKLMCTTPWDDILAQRLSSVANKYDISIGVWVPQIVHIQPEEDDQMRDFKLREREQYTRRYTMLGTRHAWKLLDEHPINQSKQFTPEYSSSY